MALVGHGRLLWRRGLGFVGNVSRDDLHHAAANILIVGAPALKPNREIRPIGTNVGGAVRAQVLVASSSRCRTTNPFPCSACINESQTLANSAA